ncbi:unnamed protein product [Echinostoma caproni]|uniref:Non-specific serine/threonine protein kinase n=1 Tax=Echinostoma caproni TaxID=27848 RepID=A0A183ARV1_9TREM|nr:unnamed protein product [Echinostoma caproni]
MGDSPDAGLLPLLGRIEGTFTYRHYQLTQALNENLMNSFVTWCMHRLVLISCRPVFTYHLSAVSVIMRKVLVMLERHHLNLFLGQSTRLLRLLNDVLHAMNRFDLGAQSDCFHFTVNCFTLPEAQQLIPSKDKDNGLNLETDPITLLDLRSAYLCQTLSTAVVSFYSYMPQLVLNACHTFGMIVELCDIPSKHCALEALLHSGSCILPSTTSLTSTPPSIVLLMAVDCLQRAVVLSASTLSDWFEGRLPMPPDEMAAVDLAGFEQLVVVERLLMQFWTSKTEHTALRGVLLDYVACSDVANSSPDHSRQHNHQEITISLQDGILTGLFGVCDVLPEWTNYTVPSASLIYQLETNECKMELVIQRRLDRIPGTKWKQILSEFRLPQSDPTELLHYGPIWIRLGRLWGAFRSDTTRFARPPISADQFAHVIGPLVHSSLISDVHEIGRSLRCFTHIPAMMRPNSRFMLSVARKLLRDLIKRSHRISLSKQVALFLANLSAIVVCRQTGCTRGASLYCRTSHIIRTEPMELATTTGPEEPDLEVYTVAEQMELLNLLLDMRHVDVTYEAVVDLTVHLSHHISWTTMSATQVVEFLSLIQNELPHYTPPIVRAIYAHVSGRLSNIDLSTWLGVHTQLIQSIHVRPRQGPSSALNEALLDEYRILQYGALGCCLGRHYANLLCLSPTGFAWTDSVDRRNSGEVAGVTCSSVSDHLITVVAALCRLGVVHQYTHTLYGAVYVQVSVLCDS